MANSVEFKEFVPKPCNKNIIVKSEIPQIAYSQNQDLSTEVLKQIKYFNLKMTSKSLTWKQSQIS